MSFARSMQCNISVIKVNAWKNWKMDGLKYEVVPKEG